MEKATHELKREIILETANDIKEVFDRKYGIEVDELDIAAIINEHLSFIFDTIEELMYKYE